jgi:hypothetical protein
MSSWLLRHCLALALATMAFAGGAVEASGLVVVRISPDQGPPGAKIDVSASGFRDQGRTPNAVPTYWADINIGSIKILTNLPVEADLTFKAQGIVINAPPGDHWIVVTMYARDASGTRYIDDGAAMMHVFDPGPVHPLSVSMQVTAPAHTLGGTDIVVNVTLQSGPGDKTKVGLYAGVYDQANKLVRSLRFPAASGAQGFVTDRIEMMDPNRTEQFASEPFVLAPGTWRLHFTLLVNNVAHDTDRIVTVTAAPNPTPKKLPPHLAPGTRD